MDPFDITTDHSAVTSLLLQYFILKHGMVGIFFTEKLYH